MDNVNVLYAVSDLPDWIELAKRLRERYNWQPVYWITTHKIHPLVKKAFPDTILEKFHLGNKGIFPERFSRSEQPLDSHILDSFLYYEKIVLKMMDRQDIYQTFSYHQRKRLFYKQLEYWLFTLKELKVKKVLFSETPHFVSHYICFAVCQYYNIKTITFAAINIQGLVFPKQQITDTPHVKISGKSKKCVSDRVEEYIDRHIGKSEYSEPWYMVKQKKDELNSFSRINLWLKTYLYIGKSKLLYNIYKFYDNAFKTSFINSVYHDHSYFIQRHGFPENSEFLKGEIGALRLKKKKTINSLKGYYKSIAVEMDQQVPYIYFPLHYQPERSSCPEGGYFVDQLLIIKILSNCLPMGWKLLIKEHPSQFVPQMKGYLGRSIDFYKDVEKLKNVSFIDLNLSSINLIEHSKAVVTITGSAGVEALLNSKPVLLFGAAWFKKMPGVFPIETNFQCEEALGRILKGFHIDSNSIIEHLKALSDYTILGYLTQATKEASGITQEENIHNLFSAIGSIGLCHK